MSATAVEIDLDPLATVAGGAALVDSMLPLLGSVKVKLSVRVGGAQLSVGELMELKEGAVIELDRTVEQPLDVLVDGHVIARGVLVAIDEHFGVRITQTRLNRAA